MLTARLFILLGSIFLATAQSKDDQKQTETPKSAVLIATPIKQDGNDQRAPSVPQEINDFYARQQFQPELYGLTYLQPDAPIPRLQPQIVLYGPGGQGQPILINPGNPPGNFLIPQGPGPNVILRNNPPGPQGFPVAGYPKPAHIPPIEKDAEEIPTNPDQIPPLPSSGAKPASKPRGKPEKLETFTEPNQPEPTTPNINQGQFPQLNPETVSLRPGQRFFVLNGDHIYNYPFEAQPQIQGDLPAFRYTNVQPFPQNPPKYLQPFAQEPPQFLQSGERQIAQLPISVPDVLLRNSFVNSQQPVQQADQQQPAGEVPANGKEQPKEGALKTAQQYFRTGVQPVLLQDPQEFSRQYLLGQPGFIYGQQLQGLEAVARTNSKDDIVSPQLVGQFRFTPQSAPGYYPFRDDLDNDAIVVDASFDAPTNYDGQDDSDTNTEAASSTPQAIAKESESSMAQAGPQATAIAGPGGVAGSAPRGTAIVGKGGLAVSSPQATAVAGTKDEDEKKKTTKKE